MSTKERILAFVSAASVRLCSIALSAGVLTSCVLAAPAHVTAQDGLRLRAGSDTGSRIITLLPHGAELDVVEAVGDNWFRVTAGEYSGFVSSEYVAMTGTASAPDTQSPAPSQDSAVFGTVNASTLNVRSGPGTDHSKVTTISSGTLVQVLGEENGWYHIDFESGTGYVSREYITVQSSQDNSADTSQPTVPTPEPADTKVYGMVTASSLNVRSGAGADFPKVRSLSSGAQVEILEKLDGWYRIDGGYVSADYILLLDASTTELQAQIVAYAHTFLGYPYVYGANGPNAFDCSSLMQYIYKHFGYTINRSATQQLKNGVPVSKENLQPGDLVFFNSEGTGVNRATHVGIYIGNGEFLHASNKKVGVIITKLSEPYRVRTYTTARRII